MKLASAATSFSQAMPRSRWKARIGRLSMAGLAHVGVSPIAPVRLKDGTIMILDTRDRTASEAAWNGTFDPGLITVLRACVPPAGRLLDVGANVGLIAVPMARHLAPSGGRVIAVEPVQSNRERLLESARLNDVTIDVIAAALGDHEGDIEMHREASLGSSTGNAIMGAPGEGTGVTTSVPLKRLDTLGLGPFDVIKLDVEGSELLFLRGASDYISEHRPVIQGEFNSVLMPRFGHSVVDVGRLIEPWGYRLVAFAGAYQPIEVEASPGIGNLLLVPSERLESTLAALRSGGRAARP